MSGYSSPCRRVLGACNDEICILDTICSRAHPRPTQDRLRVAYWCEWMLARLGDGSAAWVRNPIFSYIFFFLRHDFFFQHKIRRKKGGRKTEKKNQRKKTAPFGEQKNLICFTLKSFFFATVFATVFSVARNFA